MIGASTKNAKSDYWLESLAKGGFKLIELNHRSSCINFDDEHIQRLKGEIRKHDIKLTLHSGTTDLLHMDKLIEDYQLLLLKSEIKYAPRLGIRHAVFHLPKYLNHEKDKKRLEKFFTSILEFAKEHNVQLFLENDSNGPWSKPEDFLPYFKKYKTLKHLLDIGHLNRALHAKLVKSEKDYIEKMGKYIGYVHLHDNHGIEDEHKGLGSGNAKLDIILPEIRKLKPGIIIIETHDIKEAFKSVKVLKRHGF